MNKEKAKANRSGVREDVGVGSRALATLDEAVQLVPHRQELMGEFGAATWGGR